MSTTKPMKEVSVEEILQNYNLIVPEIQREYVWGNNEYGIFETFISDIKDGFELEGEMTPEMISLKQTINNPLLDDNARRSLSNVLETLLNSSKSINIGFLYSYKPGYYIGNDREEDLFLIDGQQRFTTLFLILFYFSIKENRKEDFVSLFKFDANNEKIAFDYRVRTITHQFIIDLVTNTAEVKDLLEIQNKQWFLSNYENDVTIKSIIGKDDNSGVFRLSNKMFEKDERMYFDYIKKDIKFWHFKTEETSQGEELYITMNSRGQQLADNETIRAKLFDSPEVKDNPLIWSEKWEQWQNFFWRNRHKTNKEQSADEGFNEFLRWVQLLKMYETDGLSEASINSVAYQKFIKYLQWDAGLRLDMNYLSLHDIELTFKSLNYLYVDFSLEIKNNLTPQYTRSFEINNLIEQKWISQEKGIAGQIDLFRLLPTLLFCNKHYGTNTPINAQNLLRLVRTLYSLSKDETIGKAIRNQMGNVLMLANSLELNEDITGLLSKVGISKTILNNELKNKLELYKSTDSRISMENLFWFGEDLDYNDGEINHLIQLTKKVSTITEHFDLITFEKIIDIFKDFIENEDMIWGNLISSDVYSDLWDRVEYDGYWYKKDGFLQFIELRIDSLKTLEDFFTDLQKKFIQNYKTIEEIESESNSKNQLYIYYILSNNNILTNKPYWAWNECFNFGKFENFPGYKSLFAKSSIYQLYNNAFRENANKVLIIQNTNYKGALNELIEWASE